MAKVIIKGDSYKSYLVLALVLTPLVFIDLTIWLIVVAGLVSLGIHSYVTLYRAKEELQRTFPVCPFCGSTTISSKLGASIHDTMICENCGAQWEIYLSSLTGELKWAKLTTPSTYGGLELIGQKKPPKFWISLSKQRHPSLWGIKLKTAQFAKNSGVKTVPEKLLEIKSNIDEYIAEGDAAYITGRYTAATNLYFKALVGICDYVIMKEQGIKPKNHDERFEILKIYEPSLYKTVSKFFTLYRKAYSEKISQEECKRLKDTVLNLKNSIIT